MAVPASSFFAESMMHFILAQSMRANTGITQTTLLRWRLFSKLSLGINIKSKCSKLHEFTKFKPWAPKALSWLLDVFARSNRGSIVAASQNTVVFHRVYWVFHKDRTGLFAKTRPQNAWSQTPVNSFHVVSVPLTFGLLAAIPLFLCRT